MPRLTIDGTPCAVEDGLTLAAIIDRLGIELPQRCHDVRLAPWGGCRMCLVEVAGEPRPVTACTTVAQEGMVVHTDTERVRRLRETLRSLFDAHEPEAWSDDTHPYLGIDMTRCIRCDRCVRICDEVQGQFVWKVWQRGDRVAVRPADGISLLTSGCTSCGACADTCPTGAIFDRQSGPDARVEGWVRTTCVYCGVGCQIEVGHRDGGLVRIRPAHAPVNRGHLCAKGRYAFGFNEAPDRVTTPLIRRAGRWETASWDAAFEFAAQRLHVILDRDGPDALGVLGSARATNEENYLIQKFARVVLGTNNVDCCARVCHTPSAAALKHMLGTGAATNSFDDIERAALILVAGANPTSNHPVVGARIRQAVRRGARLVVIDPRRTELARIADVHLAPLPGRNVPLFNAMAAVLIEEGFVDRAFIGARVDGYAEFADFVRAFRPEDVAAHCGVDATDIRAAARLYACAKPALSVHGLGLTEHHQGTEGVMALINLALLTGNLGKPGAGINPLRGQNNVQGAALMGCDPVTLPGGQDFATAGARCAAHWGMSLPATHGLSLMGMMDAAEQGRLKGLWCCGYDIHLTLPLAGRARALENLDLLIVQDLFLNETAKVHGHVFFPAASVFEREGTFMNADRRVQRVRRVVDPPGEARSDLWIIQQLARRMGGAGFDQQDAEVVWDEVRVLWPAGAGLSYARLGQESLHWPCPSGDHPGTPVLHETTFAHGHRAALRCIPDAPSPEEVDAEHPFLLVTGRHLQAFNAGTLTSRTPGHRFRPTDALDISPADAARLGITEGVRVSVKSRHGAVVMPAHITDEMREGQLFTTFHCPEVFTNRLMSPVRDREVGTPEYKRTAVAVARAP